MKPCADTFDMFVGLKEDWDSYGGIPITPEAITTAKQIIADAGKCIDAEVGPLPNGGIDIEWEIGDRALLIEVSPSGGVCGWALQQGHTYTNGTYVGDVEHLIGTINGC